MNRRSFFTSVLGALAVVPFVKWGKTQSMDGPTPAMKEAWDRLMKVQESFIGMGKRRYHLYAGANAYTLITAYLVMDRRHLNQLVLADGRPGISVGGAALLLDSKIPLNRIYVLEEPSAAV